jgi:hypothetical protein
MAYHESRQCWPWQDNAHQTLKMTTSSRSSRRGIMCPARASAITTEQMNANLWHEVRVWTAQCQIVSPNIPISRLSSYYGIHANIVSTGREHIVGNGNLSTSLPRNALQTLPPSSTRITYSRQYVDAIETRWCTSSEVRQGVRLADRVGKTCRSC